MKSRLLRMPKRRFKKWLPVMAVVLLALAAAPWLVGKPCPKRIVIATGRADGAYFSFANRYREILDRDGITLDVRSTAGSVSNLKLLNDDGEDVVLAVVQGGVAGGDAAAGLESIASLYFEPVWVFHRRDLPVTRLTDLAGRRIAVGANGSGTQAMAIELLKANQLAGQDARAGTKTVVIGGRQAAEALKTGKIDAAVFVVSPRAALVRELLERPDVELMSFRRAESYRRKFPFLSSITLTEGMLHLNKNLPAKDIVLLAPTANLVARKDVHPALIPLMLGAIEEVHRDGGFLAEPGVFPTARYADVPMNASARRYLKSGPPFFYRYFPFGMAAWLDRVKLMLIPLCTLLIPLLKLAPPVYRWRIRSKIYRWYRVVRKIDRKLESANFDASREIERLTTLERELALVSVPLSYMEEFYNLRLHIAFVLDRLKKEVEKECTTSPRALLRTAA